MALTDGILRLKREKQAIILAHNYQRPEVQDIADYVGDSIELSRRAMEEKDAKIIVFAAVDFMAENAALLNPEKKVLLPNQNAKCPMARMLVADEIRKWKQKYPELPVMLYVNTYAEAKAECDICCTSANAVQVAEALNSDALLFGPDKNLALYVEKCTGKKMIAVPERGFCPTHVLFQRDDIELLKQAHPDATVIVHPECTPEVQETADYIGSTSQMCRFVDNSASTKFIIGTESGLMHRLRKDHPEKEFMLAYDGAICPNMKLNTLESIFVSLRDEKYIVTIPEPVADKARKALENMFSVVSTHK